MSEAKSSLPQLTSGTTGFQSAFLNSISPTEKPKGSNNSEGSEPVSVPTSVSNGSALGSSTGTPNAVSMGGSSTQRRALQNLPQNTKVVRGPNGQYSLQKVQTIELTFEQQNVSFFLIFAIYAVIFPAFFPHIFLRF